MKQPFTNRVDFRLFSTDLLSYYLDKCNEEIKNVSRGGLVACAHVSCSGGISWLFGGQSSKDLFDTSQYLYMSISALLSHV